MNILFLLISSIFAGLFFIFYRLSNIQQPFSSKELSFEGFFGSILYEVVFFIIFGLFFCYYFSSIKVTRSSIKVTRSSNKQQLGETELNNTKPSAQNKKEGFFSKIKMIFSKWSWILLLFILIIILSIHFLGEIKSVLFPIILSIFIISTIIFHLQIETLKESIYLRRQIGLILSYTGLVLSFLYLFLYNINQISYTTIVILLILYQSVFFYNVHKRYSNIFSFVIGVLSLIGVVSFGIKTLF